MPPISKPSTATLAVAIALVTGALPTSGLAVAEEDATVEAVDARPFFFALSVKDAAASEAWYGKAFGFETAREVEVAAPGLDVRLLHRDGAFLELIQSDAARSPGELTPPVERRFLLHGVFKIGFVVDDLDAARRRLEALGIPLRGQVFTESDGSMRSLQVEDPDGNVVQLFELLE